MLARNGNRARKRICRRKKIAREFVTEKDRQRLSRQKTLYETEAIVALERRSVGLLASSRSHILVLLSFQDRHFKMPQQNARRAQLAVLAGALIVQTVYIFVILCEPQLRECPTPIDHPAFADSPCQFSGSFDLSEDQCNVTVCQSEKVYGGVLACKNTSALQLESESLLMLDAWLSQCFKDPDSPCVEPEVVSAKPNCDRQSTNFPLITVCREGDVSVGVIVGGAAYLEHASLQKLHRILELFVVHLA